METKFYCINEVAKMLGVSRWVISEACKRDRVTGKAKLGTHRLGKRVIISEEDLQAYLKVIHVPA